MQKIRKFVQDHKIALPAILCLLLIGIAYAVGRHSIPERTAAEKPAALSQEQTQDAERLRVQLDISKSNAETL